MQTVDLTVVADPACSTSRAYLAYLRAGGYRAKKVLLVEFAPARRAPLARLQQRLGAWIGTVLRRRVSAPPLPYPEALFRQCCDEMQSDQSLRVDYFGEFDFASYGESYERCAATGYSDPRFQERLRRQPGALLYTCGDRVPPALTDDPALRILHIHPGLVPAMRGSDGLLWSLAVRGRPGASCFYMDAGIDTGALIASGEFAPPRFPRLAGLLADHEPVLYGALLHAYDPHLRGQTLLKVLRANPGRSLRELPRAPQPKGEGRWWFAMHPRLRRKLFAERILC